MHNFKAIFALLWIDVDKYGLSTANFYKMWIIFHTKPPQAVENPCFSRKNRIKYAFYVDNFSTFALWRE